MADTKDTKDEKIKYAGALVRSGKKVLLGREATSPGWSESGRWSDFGGAPEVSDVSIQDSIARECYEETMGILGCVTTLTEKIKATHIQSVSNARIAVLEIPYDATLPDHYNLIYKYLLGCAVTHPTWKSFKYIPTCPKGYCEKVELKWFDLDEILNAGPDQTTFRKSFLASIKELKL